MSRLRLFPDRTTETNNLAQAAATVSAFPQQHHVLIEAVPVPVGTNEYEPEKVRAQGLALQNFRSVAKDIFEPNECRCVSNAGQRLYQTQETYGTSMSIEQMIETMSDYDLTMRVNFRRPGVHSATTCMELSAPLLNRLLEESEDAKSQKTLELRVKAEASVSVPRHGSMYITVCKNGEVHTLSHVDYKIMSSYDSMYHSN